MSAGMGDGEDTLVRSSFVRIPSEARSASATRYTMADLERLTGFSGRTIRYYIQEGLVRAAHGRGPSATYDRDHLLRLLRIAELKTEVSALDQIRERLAAQSTADLEAHFTVRNGPEEERWRRVRVHPRLELHVREIGPDRDYRFEQALDQIVQHARIVLEHFENER
jgi:DNA-binding transcriptional MerR regulator